MSDCPVAYDISRLTVRFLNPTPNGIDRIDFAFARHFLGSPSRDRAACFALMMNWPGPRAISVDAAAHIVNEVSAHWGEGEAPKADENYQRIVSWIARREPELRNCARVARGRTGQASRVLGWIKRHGLPIGASAASALPEGARYLNVSQFPLWIPEYFGWLKRRPDVRPVFFIHDLLPIQHPEYFRKAEYERHLRRLATLAEYGAAAIVTTKVVRDALQRHLADLGRAEMPILIASIPAAPIFSERMQSLSQHDGPPYFVACGTIEPRKNHLLLLHVWRELVRRDGPSAPKLILVGARGWENENVIDLLERCSDLRDHIIETSGLSTPGFNALLDSACALLMPSFAEGYGLPVVEAIKAGTPVIASDIPAFREIVGGSFLIAPIDGEKWLETIRSFAAPQSAARAEAIAQQSRIKSPTWDDYFAGIESFLKNL